MITKKQYREAIVICNKYCNQIAEVKSENTSTIGARVKLSAWGLEMQGNRKSKRRGKVVDYIKGHSENDGTVFVKWDGVIIPESMHQSQVEILK